MSGAICAPTREHTEPTGEPFDSASTFAWLAARAAPGMETAEPERYERVLLLPGGPAWLELTPSADAGIVVRSRTTTADDDALLRRRVRAMFDLDADSAAIDHALAAHPELTGAVRAAPGLRVPGSLAPDELLVRALIGQQITVAAARTALSGLVDALGEPAPAHIAPGRRLFPTMATLAERAPEVLRGPRARVESVQRVAGLLADGALTITPDAPPDELRASLLAVKGIGPWTADYVLMRVCRHPDTILVGDVALRNGARALGIPAEPRELAVWARRTAPYRSYLAMHLWRAALAAPRPPRHARATTSA